MSTKTFICGPIPREEISGEILFVCSLMATSQSRRLWASYRTAKGRSKGPRIAPAHVSSWMKMLIRRGSYIPGAGEMFLCDLGGISVRFTPESLISIGSDRPDDVRAFVSRWLERGYRIAERRDGGDRKVHQEVHDVEAALLETTPPVPAVAPPSTHTIMVDGFPVSAVNQEITAGGLSVTAATNCPQPGDDGRTVLVLENMGGFVRCGLDGGPSAPVSRVEIVLSSDAGFETFLDGLRFATKSLNLQRRRNAKRPTARKG